MKIVEFSVCGIRSLELVQGIAMGNPTILAGCNDSGKSTTLEALAFLLGDSNLKADDYTYLNAGENGTENTNGTSSRPRATEAWVEGLFTLSDEEEIELKLPSPLRIRRRSRLGANAQLEAYLSVPQEPRLRDLNNKSASELRDLIVEFALSKSATKASMIESLEEHAKHLAHVDDWVPATPTIKARMPQILFFGGKVPDVDDTVRTALMGRYQTHLKDEDLRGKVSDLERDLTLRLKDDAEALCNHIKDRCADLVNVVVEPEVSFKSGLTGTKLMLARSEGEPVAMVGAGTGRARRVALAIWEWTSDILRSSNSNGEATLFGNGDIVVAYDEPDTHLDYVHQRRIMNVIKSQCDLPHVQVIAATHSLNLIDGVDIADIIHMTLSDERTSIERLTDFTHRGLNFHIGKIASALGVRNSVLLYERCFVGVEGTSEQQALPVLFRITTGISLQSAGIALWACNNNEGALHFASYLAEHSRNVCFVVDEDSKTRPKSLFTIARLQLARLDPLTQAFFLGDPNEIEELFTDIQWANAANQLWPRNDSVTWTNEHFASLRSNGKFSYKLEEMLKTASDQGPQGKPEALLGIANTMSRPEDVPKILREVFAELIALAN